MEEREGVTKFELRFTPTPWSTRLVVEGPIAPSSESLTHGQLYALDRDSRFVFHVHSPELWRAVGGCTRLARVTGDFQIERITERAANLAHSQVLTALRYSPVGTHQLHDLRLPRRARRREQRKQHASWPAPSRYFAVF